MSLVQIFLPGFVSLLWNVLLSIIKRWSPIHICAIGALSVDLLWCGVALYLQEGCAYDVIQLFRLPQNLCSPEIFASCLCECYWESVLCIVSSKLVFFSFHQHLLVYPCWIIPTIRSIIHHFEFHVGCVSPSFPTFFSCECSCLRDWFHLCCAPSLFWPTYIYGR